MQKKSTTTKLVHYTEYLQNKHFCLNGTRNWFFGSFCVDGIHFFIMSPLLLEELAVVGSSGFRKKDV